MEENHFLEKFYRKLVNNLIMKYKHQVNSVLIRFFDIKSVDRFKLLKNSSIKKFQIPFAKFNELFKKGFVRETDEVGEYTITAKGIFEIEKQNDTISNETLLESIDNKYFNVYTESEKTLNEKEKIIIFSMIASRTFSEGSCVDLKKGDPTLNTWEKIIIKSYDLLKSLGLISKLKEEEIFGKEHNVHKVCIPFRAAKYLPKKTKDIYQGTRKQTYYLNLYDGHKIEKENLKLLFQKIFGDKRLDSLELDKVCNFCNTIATTENVHIFDVKKHIFHHPKFDNIIRDALLTL